MSSLRLGCKVRGTGRWKSKAPLTIAITLVCDLLQILGNVLRFFMDAFVRSSTHVSIMSSISCQMKIASLMTNSSMLAQTLARYLWLIERKVVTLSDGL